MTTPSRGSRRPPADITHAPSKPPQPDATGAQPQPGQGRATKQPSSNLFLPRSPLVGRDHEVTAVQYLLLQEQIGLLTLTGPGGIGKTRLALQVAANLLDHFIDGVHFVSLASIRDAELVGLAIAETLGLKEAGGQPLLESLQAYLAPRQLLLVLDNFEQVLAAAPLVKTLVAACSQLKVLVTSRAPLHLYGEQEYPVPPLALPDVKRPSAIDTEFVNSLAQVAGVALFIQRAQAVKPDFMLTEANAGAVAEICIGLDGLPLAIELAAAKVKLFAPPTLLARLQQRLTLLTGGAHDLPARQRTLRDEIAWSYDLLVPGEQALFQRLSVFLGGFTLDAVQAISSDLKIDFLEALAGLVDKSLVRALEVGSGEARYEMLETIREFGLEQLMSNGDEEVARRQHAQSFLELAERIAPSLWGANQGSGIAQLRVEHDNLRAALAWSRASAGESETILRLTTALQAFWIVTGNSREGRRWSEAALECATAEANLETRAKALVNVGMQAVMHGDATAGHGWLEAGLALARTLHLKRLMYTALNGLSFIAHGQRDDTLAISLLEESLTIAQQLGDAYCIGSSLSHLAGVACDNHDYVRAQALYYEGLMHFQAIGADWDVADALAYLGLVARYQGDYQHAAEFLRDALARWQSTGVFLWKGVADCLEGLAGACVAQRHFLDAARLFGAAAALRELTGSRSSPSGEVATEDEIAALRAHFDADALAAAWDAGHALPVEQAVDYALALPIVPVPTSMGSLPSPVTYPAGLTAREVEVLRLLAQGLTYAQIAEQLIISQRTVNAHVISIYSKLDVHSRSAATRFAVEHGLV